MRELLGFQLNLNDEEGEEEFDEMVKSVVTNAWIRVAEEVYGKRSNDQEANLKHIKEMFVKNEVLLRSLKERCPHFAVILSHMLVLRFGVGVVGVSDTSTTTNWTEDDCRAVGRSVATLVRERGTGEEAMRAWRIQYRQLKTLYDEDEVEGFEEFMLTIFKVSACVCVYVCEGNENQLKGNAVAPACVSSTLGF